MTYEHLTGRLIETQRSMLGESAIEIARSVEGLSVTDDGNVTALDGDDREVVDELVRTYVDVLGKPAEQRLSTAAQEFESELILPPALGGPDEIAPDPNDESTASDTESPDADDSGVSPERPSSDRPAVHGPAAAPGASGAVSDGGTLTLHSPTPGHTAEFSGAVEPAGEPGIGDDAVETDTSTDTGSAEGETEGDSEPDVAAEAEDDSEGETEDGSASGPLIVRYTVASDLDSVDRSSAGLDAVYLLPTAGSGWQAPVTAADAVVEAVSERTDLDDPQLYALTDSIDPERLFATLAGESGETVSFHYMDVTVTFHRSGSLAIH